MKILMATMGLDIGGAETHLVELSKELKNRGYEIIVASNGGVYEKELVDYGIKCYRVPMHKRSLALMYKSYKKLEEIITKEKPDIVHAHARIPGYLCGLLHKKYSFRFVTTAHWVFRVNAVLKSLTNWGEKVIAVSDDIKDYLISNYGISKDDITITVNGIDTDKFSPSTSAEVVYDELGLDKTARNIVYVSRLDESRSLSARQLVSIADRLKEKFNDINIIIAGAGDDFDNIKASADSINAKAGKDYVYMLGARSDINNIVATADLFIGVSRSALEAMAEAKMTILAGNEGYLGLFTDDKLGTAKESNFCLRGCMESSPDRLYDDIEQALLLCSEERNRIETFSRDVILSDYSVKKMTDDYEKCYAGLIS